MKRCRVCGSKNLRQVFDAGNIYLSSFVKKGKRTKRSPMVLDECQDCTLVQMRHTAQPEELYVKKYWYRSGINRTIRNDLKLIASEANALTKPGDVVLDIGANDGTLLSFVSAKRLRVGVEPAKNLREDLSKHCDVVGTKMWKYTPGMPKANVITAIGMFYDMDDPNQFVGDVAKALADGGTFIAQLMTLEPMLRNADVGNVCHEHLEYYTYKSLVELYERNGLEIFRVEKNGINGGSYKLYARHGNRSVKMREEKPDFEKFQARLLENGMRLRNFLIDAKREGKKVYGYGASTKGNTVLQYFGIGPELVTAIADKNEEKHGLYTVGTQIPIVPEDEARENADYLLVLPYGFIKDFMQRERRYVEKRGIKFVTWAPKFKVLDS